MCVRVSIRDLVCVLVLVCVCVFVDVCVFDCELYCVCVWLMWELLFTYVCVVVVFVAGNAHVNV